MLPGEIPTRERAGARVVRLSRISLLALGWIALGCGGPFASMASAQLTALRVEDYARPPVTGSTAYPGNGNAVYLARVNFMADNPANSNQFFVNDLNGPLYILDKTTKQFTKYLDFNGRGTAPGLFDRLYTTGGFAGGFITFQFDPDYVHNGKFYTVHLEQGTTGSQVPSNANYPGLNTTGYTPTTPFDQPGNNNYQTVLVEWTDTNVNNNTFQGTGRELLRMDVRDRIHPMGDIIFNPLAQPGDPDWRVMYLTAGDAGAGEQTSPIDVHMTPQRLDTLTGKILRIIPDLAEHTDTSTVSSNGRYRIPDDNPFTDQSSRSVFDEIYALGLRNPHRISWDVDPSDPNPETNNHMIVNDIGLHTWEEVNIIHPGGNYGYSEREGNQRLVINGGNLDPQALPTPDTIPVQVNAFVTNGDVTPIYPVIQYGHRLPGQDQIIAGDSISSGFVYRGSKIPQLYGKYLFGDITTGAIFYSDFAEMLAADDGDPDTMAEIHPLNLLWDDPNDSQGELEFGTIVEEDAIRGPMFQIVDRAYHNFGGHDPNLPGTADVTGGQNGFGRADIRIQMGEDGELYILSKSDGMIRAITGPEPLAGDYNYDGSVDELDYQVWKDSFGTTVPRLGLWADGNKDGLVDAADYTFWRDHFLAAGAGSIAIPEPATWLLLVIAAGCSLARRRQR